MDFRMKKFKYVIVLLALFPFLSFSQTLSEQTFRQLANGNGELRVIVTLKSAAKKTDGTLLGNGEWMNLGNYIDEAQRKLAKEMGWRNFNDIVRFKQVPALAKSVTSSEYKKLNHSNQVQSVHIDNFNPIFLSNSAQSIGLHQFAHSEYTGIGTTVAVLDSGVDANHPFFQGRVKDGACFSGYGSCPGRSKVKFGVAAGLPCPASVKGCDHGTHVAGIVAGNNGSTRGVASQANILAVNVFSNDGQKMGAFDSDIIQGLEWVYRKADEYNIAAVNMSLGGGKFFTTCDDKPIRYIVDMLAQKNIAVVVAAGNESYTNAVAQPACISSAVTVGSTEPDGHISYFSNSYSYIDIVAPGGKIASSVPGGGYAIKSGTSMAAPQVAGAFALLKGAFPQATLKQLKIALQQGKQFVDKRNNVKSAQLDLVGSVKWLSAQFNTSNQPQKPDPALRNPKPKSKCSERIDGILVESTTGDCNSTNKIEW